MKKIKQSAFSSKDGLRSW